MFTSTTKTAVVASVAAAFALLASPAYAGRSGNVAPVISGTPVTNVLAGRSYSFKPTASDANRDRLTFKINGKPLWATFSSATGMLSGTPSVAYVGRYANIVVSVCDGKVTKSLRAFSITVAGPPTQSVTLNWRPPIQNVDGTPITDLVGFNVVYGTAPGQYSSTLSLPSASINSVVVEGLAAGTWYFAVKAVNASGVESNYSAEVSKLM